MRAHEFITEDQKRRPEISLRHLNDLKHVNRARAASLARQAALKRIMYANPAREHERIELEKRHGWNWSWARSLSGIAKSAT